MKPLKLFVPSETEIFGLKIKVKFVHNLTEDKEKVNGLATFATGLIELDRGNHAELTENTYLHEVVHHILYALEYHKHTNDERFVQGLASGLQQAINTMEYKRGLPTQFNILGNTIRVVFCETITEDEDKGMYSRQSTGEILINNVMLKLVSPDMFISIFLAQVVYECLYYIGEHKVIRDEKFILLFARGLYQALTHAKR